MLQLRDGLTDDVYSFDRDIVQLFPRVCLLAMDQLALDPWGPEIKALTDTSRIDPRELAKVPEVMARYTGIAPEYDSPAEAYVEAGFFRLPPAVRLAALVKVGQAAMSAYHFFLREANRAHQLPRQVGDAFNEADRVEHTLSAESERVRLRRAAELLLTQEEGRSKLK